MTGVRFKAGEEQIMKKSWSYLLARQSVAGRWFCRPARPWDSARFIEEPQLHNRDSEPAKLHCK